MITQIPNYGKPLKYQSNSIPVDKELNKIIFGLCACVLGMLAEQNLEYHNFIHRQDHNSFANGIAFYKNQLADGKP